MVSYVNGNEATKFILGHNLTNIKNQQRDDVTKCHKMSQNVTKI